MGKVARLVADAERPAAQAEENAVAYDRVVRRTARAAAQRKTNKEVFEATLSGDKGLGRGGRARGRGCPRGAAWGGVEAAAQTRRGALLLEALFWEVRPGREVAR
eukprot:6922746-Pyramimonas_sp.AAC.1